MNIEIKKQLYTLEQEIDEIYDGLREKEKYFNAAKLFSLISDDQRVEIMSYYCKTCGIKNPICQCWNDE